MNNFVRLSAATLACALAITTLQTVRAQGNAPGSAPAAVNPTIVRAGHGGNRLAKLGQALGLSDSQKDQIKTIMKTRAQQRKTIRNSQAAPDQQKAQLKALKQATRQQIAQVLTPEQRAKWKQLHKQHKGGNA